MQEKYPYQGPEMNYPEPEEIEQKGVDYLSVMSGERIHVGDQVSVLRTNGDIEHDWILRSFGAKSAVVEKPSTGDKKVIPVEEFTSWQSRFKGREGNIYTKPEIGSLAQTLEDTARKIGIDMTDPDWEKKYEEKIHKMMKQA